MVIPYVPSAAIIAMMNNNGAKSKSEIDAIRSEFTKMKNTLQLHQFVWNGKMSMFSRNSISGNEVFAESLIPSEDLEDWVFQRSDKNGTLLLEREIKKPLLFKELLDITKMFEIEGKMKEMDDFYDTYPHQFRFNRDGFESKLDLYDEVIVTKRPYGGFTSVEFSQLGRLFSDLHSQYNMLRDQGKDPESLEERFNSL